MACRVGASDGQRVESWARQMLRVSGDLKTQGKLGGVILILVLLLVLILLILILVLLFIQPKGVGLCHPGCPCLRCSGPEESSTTCDHLCQNKRRLSMKRNEDQGKKTPKWKT